MKDAAWPADLILDMTKSNWTEWEHMLSLAVRQCGIRPWLDGSIPCPDAGTSPDAYHIWRHNDDSLSAFITRYISKPDILHTKACKTAAKIFSRLRVLHENQGAYAQLTLLTKALLVHFKYDKPLSETAAEIVQFHNRIIAMGSIKDDDILAALLLHAMSENFLHLQDAVQNMSHMSNFSSEMILQRVYSEDLLFVTVRILASQIPPLLFPSPLNLPSLPKIDPPRRK